MSVAELPDIHQAATEPVLARDLLAKRAFDLIVGLPLCALAIPVVAILALLLASQHRANPFFVHHRVGYRGRIIPIPKLRTLRATAPAYADKTVVALDPPTRLAAALRTTHLDEVPQLFLVPFGLLSLVGPRPRMVTEALEHCNPVIDEVNTSVPQGCTGLWQVSVAQSGRVSDHPEYAQFYVEQRTLRFDVWILWRTMCQFLGGRRIDFADIPRWTLRRPELVLAGAAS